MADQSIAHLVGKLKRAFTSHLNRSYVQAGLNINVQQFVVLVILWNQDRLPRQDIWNCSKKTDTKLRLSGISHPNELYRICLFL